MSKGMNQKKEGKKKPQKTKEEKRAAKKEKRNAWAARQRPRFHRRCGAGL